MPFPFLYTLSYIGSLAYTAVRHSDPVKALGWGIAYAAGTRIGYNALGFLQPPRARRPYRLNLKYPHSRRSRRMGYYRRSGYRRRRRRSSWSRGFAAGRRAARRTHRRRFY